MKRFKGKTSLTMAGLLLLLVLSSCTLTNIGSTVTNTVLTDGTEITETTNVNNSNTHDYFKSYETHVTKDSEARASMAKSVMTIGDDGSCVGECKGWQEAFKANAIAYGSNFQPTPYTLEKPKDLMDVVDTGVKVVGGVLEKATYVYGGVELGKAVLSNTGSTEVNMGDNGSISGSFVDTTTEVHATQIGDGGPDASIDNSQMPPEEETLSY